MRRILVPTDGTETTETAIENALNIASKFDAEIHVLSVVDTTAIHPGSRNPMLLDTFHDTNEQLVEEIVEGMERKSEVPVTGVVTEGTPHQEICDYTSAHDVDLVVMATHGRSGVKRYLIGSVTENVLRTSDVPVLTVPPDSNS